MSIIPKLLFFVCYIHYSYSEDGKMKGLEAQLKQKLLNGYDPSSRPVHDPHEAVVVNPEIALGQIINVEEKQGKVVTSLWMRFFWNDQFLTWNITEYPFDAIRLTPDTIWKPDMAIYNEIGRGSVDLNMYPIKVGSNGDVMWAYPLILESSCTMNILYFPYDTQICKIQMGSWTQTNLTIKLVLKPKAADFEHFMSNAEWDVSNFVTHRHSSKCCDGKEEWADITFSIIMHRKSLHYVWNLIVPCLAILGIIVFGFFLPPASGEKVGLGVTALLAFTVFLLMVADNLPVQSHTIPIIGRFYGCSIFLMAFGTAMTVVVLNLYYRGEFGKRPSAMIQRIFIDYIGTVLLVSNHNDCGKLRQLKSKEQEMTTFENSDAKEEHGDLLKEEDQKEANDEVAATWALIALCVDRLTMIIFLVGCTINTLLFFCCDTTSSLDPESKIGY